MTAQTEPNYPQGDKALCDYIKQFITTIEIDENGNIDEQQNMSPWGFIFEVKPDGTVNEIYFLANYDLCPQIKREITAAIKRVDHWEPATDSLGTSMLGCIKIDVLYQDEELQIWRNYLTDNSIPTDLSFEIVEQMPSFPGGVSEMMKFIHTNLKFPLTISPENGICTRIAIRFLVNEEGNVSRIRISRGCDEKLNREVIRTIRLMPKWIPGKQEGRNVAVYFTLPIRWHLKN